MQCLDIDTSQLPYETLSRDNARKRIMGFQSKSYMMTVSYERDGSRDTAKQYPVLRGRHDAISLMGSIGILFLELLLCWSEVKLVRPKRWMLVCQPQIRLRKTMVRASLVLSKEHSFYLAHGFRSDVFAALGVFIVSVRYASVGNSMLQGISDA